MKSKKYDMILAFGLILLIIIIITISSISVLTLNNTMKLFHHTYEDSFQWITADIQINANLYAIQNAIKDALLSKNTVQLETVIKDIEIYDIEINKNFTALEKINCTNPFLPDITNAYKNWKSISDKTIEFLKNNQYEEAANNEQTVGSVQLNLLNEKIQLFINYEKTEIEITHQSSDDISTNSLYLLLGMSLFSIILAVGISLFIRKKLLDYRNELFKEKEQLRITFDSIGDGVITTDINSNVQKLNKVAAEFTGWKAEEAFGKPFLKVFDITNEITGEKAKDPVEEVFTTGKIYQLKNHIVLTSKDGTKRYIADSAAPIKEQNGKTTGAVMIFRDITERKLMEEQNLYFSFHDALTGLYNRRFYEEELKRLNTGRSLPISIIMGDVNGLKLINDAFGYKSGDELLQKAATAIQDSSRTDDVVARWGGDEFIILLPKTKREEAEIIIRRIKERYANEQVQDINISISFGYDTKEKIEEDIMKVLKNVEDSMHRNKALESRSIRGDTINTIINALYEKSSKEEQHSKRVSDICRNIGEAMDLSESEVSIIIVAGLIHDIGKIAIEKSILEKVGKLTGQEWDELKQHPEIGYRILSTSHETIEIADYVLAHHEHWDGTGYPKGLKGEEIPRIARIISLADAYDIMTREETYKKTLSEEEIIADIKKNAGIQFDPDIARVFIEKVLGRLW